MFLRLLLGLVAALKKMHVFETLIGTAGYTVLTKMHASETFIRNAIVTPRSLGYGDVTETYIRRSEIPSRIYAKH